MTEKKDSTIQLEQKIIHYRAEISHFEQKLAEIEWELKKEKIRNQYLQKKLYELEHDNMHSYEEEIYQLKEKLLNLEVMLEEEKNRNKALIQEEIKKKLASQKKTTIPKLQAFFNYAFLLSDFHEEQNQLSVLGDLIIHNIGENPVHDIIVCVRIKPQDAGVLSGKIARSSNESRFESDGEEWQFVHENFRDIIRKSGEYWIKPMKINTLKPSAQIGFSNFELILKQPTNQQPIIIDGFIYCKEIRTGTPLQNKIIINF